MIGIEKYEALSSPPPDALKRITGGRMNGKTDISPQWRYKAMTEQFGLCGIGWKYTIDRQWTEPGNGGEVMAFVNVSVYVKDGDKWSDPIPGTGGNMLIEAESKGLHNSDEAYKMATTDALSVAMKLIGVAASIYAGKWDGSKYTHEEGQDGKNTTPRTASPLPNPIASSTSNPPPPPLPPRNEPLFKKVSEARKKFADILLDPSFTDDDRTMAKTKLEVGKGTSEEYFIYVGTLMKEYTQKLEAKKGKTPGQALAEKFNIEIPYGKPGDEEPVEIY